MMNMINPAHVKQQVDRLSGMVNHLGNTNAQLTVQLAEMTVIVGEKQREIERLTAEIERLTAEIKALSEQQAA